MEQQRIQLASPVTELPRIGPSKAKLLQRLDIRHARDFLFTFPRRYEDFSTITPVAKLQIGKQQTVQGKVKSVTSKYGFYGRRRLLRIFVEIEDGTGVLNVTWFNLKFLQKQLPIGTELYVAGTVEVNKRGNIAMRSPALEFVHKQGERTHTAAITPVYSETAGVTSRFIRYQVRQLLPLVQAVPEYLPADIIKRNKLIDIHTALHAIHFPKNQKELAAAEHRLRFDELFFLQLAALVRRQHQQLKKAPRIVSSAGDTVGAAPSSPSRYSDAVGRGKTVTGPAPSKNELPYALTGAQERALQEVFEDLAKPHPMNRLLQGDVGSGKSAVALLAAQAVLAAGYKVLYLAPTEILARQQHGLFEKFLHNFPVHLLIGALPAQQKQQVKKYLRNESACCVVGTHALLQEDAVTTGVGLVIVDEQHRFGVAQRAVLQRGEEEMPHLLSMTATPIPRTLNLTVYGDLDVSVLDEMPPGRQPIATQIIAPAQREEAIVHLLEEIHQGRQAYVIAPLVEDSETLEQKSATRAYDEMKKWLPGIAVGLVHGQLSSAEKESVMQNFAAGAIQVLVSTAVVEVGVNVPNATIMIIEGAERFGLAQLHQFRGRIGRGEHHSTCYLFPTTIEAARSRRLKVIEQTGDGFVIAEEDLNLRGPGEVYGVAQSGFSDMQVASLLDYPTIKLARTEAAKLLEKDPELEKHPILRKKVDQKNMITHFE